MTITSYRVHLTFVVSSQMYFWMKQFEFVSDTFYSNKFIPADFPQAVFIELMQMATSGVEFSFNNTMHRQTKGIAMGGPLSPVLPNIFFGYHENKLFDFSYNHKFTNDM